MDKVSQIRQNCDLYREGESSDTPSSPVSERSRSENNVSAMFKPYGMRGELGFEDAAASRGLT